MLLTWIIPLLPRRAIVGLSKLVGRVVWLLPLREKRIGLKNLDAIFGNSKTAAEKRFILTSSFATFTQTMLDLFWFSKNPQKRLLKYVTIDPSMESFFWPQAYICITAHFGSWEIITQTLALYNVDLASIAATVKNRHIDRFICRIREKTGQTIIPQKGALRSLIARLRKQGKVGFVLDQNTSEKEGGIIVDFLGLPMSVSSAPAALAYRTGTTLFFGLCMPKEGGCYEVYSLGTLQPPPFDKARDEQVILELTQNIQDKLSEEILKYPEYWLWSYKHWRRTPGQTYPPNYPNYE